MMKAFHGSYLPHQVQFLLKPIEMQLMEDVKEKERLIQTGAKHYSEMLSPEALPSPAYWALFERACAQHLPQMAQDCRQLAALIARERQAPVLVSLARAGTPVGVALQAILSRHYGWQVPHFSVSIIRDRGIDANALRYILQQGFASEQIVFIDGWTGKGVIHRELCKAVADVNRREGVNLSSDLYVLSDLAGVTPFAAGSEDYLIPSAILNACVSGLVSRSILNEQIGATDFHGCVFFKEWAAHDVSQRFIRDLLNHVPQGDLPPAQPLPTAERAQQNRDFIAAMQAEFAIGNVNLIKPGIGEATRVLLRRQPQRLLLRDADLPAVQHLRQLAAEKQVAIEIRPRLPYLATALIQKRNHD